MWVGEVDIGSILLPTLTNRDPDSEALGQNEGEDGDELDSKLLGLDICCQHSFVRSVLEPAQSLQSDEVA